MNCFPSSVGTVLKLWLLPKALWLHLNAFRIHGYEIHNARLNFVQVTQSRAESQEAGPGLNGLSIRRPAEPRSQNSSVGRQEHKNIPFVFVKFPQCQAQCYQECDTRCVWRWRMPADAAVLCPQLGETYAYTFTCTKLCAEVECFLLCRATDGTRLLPRFHVSWCGFTVTCPYRSTPRT